LQWFTAQSATYWAVSVTLGVGCALLVAYVYTHLKFSFRLPGYHWWETIHLTTFRQKSYDEHLDERVRYARHAISIDERRADFKRVPWGGALAVVDGATMDRFEQIWFAGNHADIGGGYPENESRLSDIALRWMIEAASDRLSEEGLLLDRNVLELNSAADGMQHDETRNVLFRLAGKSDRDPKPEAVLHRTVIERFNLPGVLQYDVIAPYRPEALRGHSQFPGAYDNIPLPHQTCAQRIKHLWAAAGHGMQSYMQPPSKSAAGGKCDGSARIMRCAPTPGAGARLRHRNSGLPMCYLVEIGRLASDIARPDIWRASLGRLRLGRLAGNL
jgi:hypothetical protein